MLRAGNVLCAFACDGVYLCDVQKYSLLSRLKLLTQELVSRLSIVALTFLPNILGVSVLGPILKRVMCYSESYSDNLEKF